jgi:hypothetical protein
MPQNNQLKFDVLAQVLGTEKVDQLKKAFLELGNSAGSVNGKLVNASSATYLFEKATQFAMKAVHEFKEVLELGEKFSLLSEKTGIAAKTLTGLEGAAKQANIPFENMEKSLKKFTQQLGDKGNEKFTDTMRGLGIATVDANGKLRNAGDVIKDVSDKFAVMQDGPAKAALAVNLFGKSGSDLIPVLNFGSHEIEKFGLKMSDDFPAKAQKFNDSLKLTEKAFTEQKIAISEGLLPSLQTIVDSWNELQRTTTDNGLTKGIGEDLKIIVDIGYATVKVFSNGIDAILTGIIEVANSAKRIIQGFSELVQGSWKGYTAND